MNVVKDSDLVKSNGNTTLFRPMSALRFMGWRIFNPFRSITKSAMSMPGLDAMEARRLAVTCGNSGTSVLIGMIRCFPLSIGLVSAMIFTNPQYHDTAHIVVSIFIIGLLLSAVGAFIREILREMLREIFAKNNNMYKVLSIRHLTTGHSDIDALSAIDLVKLEDCLHRSGWSRSDMDKLVHAIHSVGRVLRVHSRYVTAAPNEDAQKLLSRALASARADDLLPTAPSALSAPETMPMEPYEMLKDMGVTFEFVPAKSCVTEVG